MKAGVWGSGCIGPRILDLGTSWRWVVLLLLFIIIILSFHSAQGITFPSPTYTLLRTRVNAAPFPSFQVQSCTADDLANSLTDGDFLLPCHTVAMWTTVPQTWGKVFVQRLSHLIAWVLEDLLLPICLSHGVNAFFSWNKINAINWKWLICPSF
jgi:hypothetical protein